MKVLRPLPRVVHLEFENHKDLLLTMFRIQEFYESPLPELFGKSFSVLDFIEAQMDDQGNIDYFSKWEGFNIPGHIVDDFFKEFSDDLTFKEFKIKNAIESAVYLTGSEDDPYYVIATKVGSEDVIAHELAHALFYLNKDYKNKTLDIIKGIKPSFRNKMGSALLEMGYMDAVIDDEIQACLGTSPMKWITDWFGFKSNNKHIVSVMDDLSKLFNEYNKG